MSQVDSRNSSAVKRARTDGGRREDDWTCLGCGNVNFSFRTTCNMRNCTQSRPADHSSKSAPKPMEVPQGYTSPAPYVGSSAPPSMYMGVPPPYGSSMFNGAPMHGSSIPPPYEVPFSGGPAYHYNYGNRISGGSPFRPSPFSAPPPYSSGPMMGNGGMYGAPQMLDRYGLGLRMPMSPSMAPPRPAFYPEDKPQNRAGESTRDNDWACPKCGNVNFSFRTACNMRKCNTPKPGTQVYGSQMQAAPSPRPFKSSKSDSNMPDGSWVCEKCSNINYPFRTKCNRQNCGADKPSETNNSQPQTTSADEQ